MLYEKNLSLLYASTFLAYASIGVKLFRAASNCWIDYYMYYELGCQKVEEEFQIKVNQFTMCD